MDRSRLISLVAGSDLNRRPLGYESEERSAKWRACSTLFLSTRALARVCVGSEAASIGCSEPFARHVSVTFSWPPRTGSLSTNRIVHRLTRCSLSLPRASDEAHDPRPKFACGSRHLSVLNPPESSSAATTSGTRSPESARIHHTCTPGLGIGHRIGGPLPGDHRRNGSSSPPRRASDNPTQLPRDQDLEMHRSRLADVENVLRSL